MSKPQLEEMTVFEQARWYSLVEAVNIIADKCEERGTPFNKIKISPLDVEKYIEGTCDTFARKIETEQEDKQAAELLRSLSADLYKNPKELQEVHT